MSKKLSFSQINNLKGFGSNAPFAGMFQRKSSPKYPSNNKPCPCGSGRLYRYCCKGKTNEQFETEKALRNGK